VIRDNHVAVALYQSLGFTRRYGLCGYLSAEPLQYRPWTRVAQYREGALFQLHDAAWQGGEGKRIQLMALAQQFPGIGTSVTVPETFTPLFAAAGYSPL
jgi:hypothetical protein